MKAVAQKLIEADWMQRSQGQPTNDSIKLREFLSKEFGTNAPQPDLTKQTQNEASLEKIPIEGWSGTAAPLYI